MMKRSFSQLDSCIPPGYLDEVEGAKETLERLKNLEEQVQSTSLSLARKYHTLYCEPEILQKILRVFVRHSLTVESEESAYYTM
jgi:hypothetical protein